MPHFLYRGLIASVLFGGVMTARTYSQEPPAGTERTNAPVTEAVSRAGPRADAVEDVIDKMTKSLRSSPYLHVRARVVSDRIGTAFVEAWMSKEADRNEVYQDGRLIYAQYADFDVTQEYAPRVAFKNGTNAGDVLLEYPRGRGSESWPRLIDSKLACDAVGVAGDSWLRTAAQDQVEDMAIPEMMAENARSSEMSDATLGGRPCHHFRSVRRLDSARAVVWELYLDQTTCEPVRQEKMAVNVGSKTVRQTTDLWIEHLDRDAGIEWKLGRRTLKGKSLSPEVAALFPKEPDARVTKEGAGATAENKSAGSTAPVSESGPSKR